MKIVTIHNDMENVARLMPNPEGTGCCFEQNEDDIVRLIREDMVRDVNARGCEDGLIHSTEDLQMHGWYIADERINGTRRLSLYSGNLADDPGCDGTVYCILDL